jgi:large subunit ribosomal protein L12
MEYVYGAMLLHSAGKEINEENLKKLLKAAGVKVDEAKIMALTSSLGDINIDDVISKSAVTAPTPSPAGAPVAEETPKTEEKPAEKKKEEEKKEEVSEEEVAEGLGALFG